MSPRRASSVGDELAAGDESADAGARGRVRAGFEVCAHNMPVIGVESVASWPCGQDSRLQPGCHRRRESAPRGVWRGLLVLTAGLVQYFYGRYLTGSVASSLRD